jgi:LysR family transcriptional regulator, glycine cleavage system transcriptional activator
MLPPLTALRAVEATARLGSIVAAARELGVSGPAVSQQIKILEEFLGRKLFNRSRSGMALTDAGQAILPNLVEGFASLAKIGQLNPQRRVPGRIVISAAPSVAVTWLPGAVARLRHRFPNQPVDLRMDDDPVKFDYGGADLRIGYGELPYQNLLNVPLVQDFVLPLCAPGFAGFDRDDLVIHTDWGLSYASLPVWRDWAVLAGHAAPDPRTGLHAGAPSLAIGMAQAGLGLALSNALIASAALSAGGLISPFGPVVPMPAPYRLYYRDNRPHLLPLITALQDYARADVGSVRSLVS